MKKMSFMKRNLLYTALLTLACLLSACSKNVTVQDPGAKYKGQSEKKIYLAGRKQLFNQDWQSCIDHFEGLLTLYPFGQYAQDAQVDLIYCYYKDDNVPFVLASSDRYIQLFPMSNYVAYAYYMRGLAEFYQNRSFLDQHYINTDYSQRDLKPLKKAFLDFQRVIQDYPHSKYAPDARRRMVYIRNIIALHSLEMGEFYYKRHAYVAAANRANDVIRHYQGSTSMPSALVLMAASYQQLGLKQSAQEAITTLKLNYPYDPDLQQLTYDQAHMSS